jgi:hypothetical protein
LHMRVSLAYLQRWSLVVKISEGREARWRLA